MKREMSIPVLKKKLADLERKELDKILFPYDIVLSLIHI